MILTIVIYAQNMRGLFMANQKFLSWLMSSKKTTAGGAGLIGSMLKVKHKRARRIHRQALLCFFPRREHQVAAALRVK
jgi:hypothetical protein